jgi:transposase-like protein
VPKRKLSDDDRVELLRLHARGSSLNDLAAAFGVTAQHVGRLVRAADASGDLAETFEPLTLEEAEQHLATAVRGGSIGALKLWFDRHGSEAPIDDDPFAQFDPPVVR